MERINKETGVIQETSFGGLMWDDKKDSDGSITRINPENGGIETSHFGLLWDNKEDSQGQIHRINPKTGEHEVSNLGIFWDPPDRTSGSSSNGFSGSGGGGSFPSWSERRRQKKEKKYTERLERLQYEKEHGGEALAVVAIVLAAGTAALYFAQDQKAEKQLLFFRILVFLSVCLIFAFGAVLFCEGMNWIGNDASLSVGKILVGAVGICYFPAMIFLNTRKQKKNRGIAFIIHALTMILFFLAFLGTR